MRVKKEILQLLTKSPEKTNVAHITTAASPKKNPEYLYRDKKQMVEAGFQVEDIDIEGKNEKELRRILADKDIIYVQGGEGYYLLKHAYKSGFDKVVKDLLNEGKIYIGVSAGSYILCPTLEMHHWKKKDKERNKYGLRSDKALNLVPFLITVHYKDEFQEDIKRGIEKSAYPVKVLRDDQAILIQDDKVKLVGEGEEIVL